MNANGDGPDPRNLEKLFGQLKGMAKEARRSVKHRRGRVLAGRNAPKLPRQICDVCNIPFDFATQTRPGVPQISRCNGCKEKLAAGFTALVGKPKVNGEWTYAFVRSSVLKAGHVYINLSDETMAAVKAKMKPDA